MTKGQGRRLRQAEDSCDSDTSSRNPNASANVEAIPPRSPLGLHYERDLGIDIDGL